mmetsp:Transcript_13312/g.26601  ORF Transcript_13312/g.26601 Transcript_13312/m.26601 type:complete len:204 (+) Transcript_13312:1181-1792(+)
MYERVRGEFPAALRPRTREPRGGGGREVGVFRICRGAQVEDVRRDALQRDPFKVRPAAAAAAAATEVAAAPPTYKQVRGQYTTGRAERGDKKNIDDGHDALQRRVVLVAVRTIVRRADSSFQKKGRRQKRQRVQQGEDECGHPGRPAQQPDNPDEGPVDDDEARPRERRRIGTGTHNRMISSFFLWAPSLMIIFYCLYSNTIC